MDTAATLAQLQAGLDCIDQGLTLFDHDLKLVAWNQAFLRLLDFPDDLARVGTPFAAFMYYNARRGEYGPGDVDTLVAERVAVAATFTPHATERVRPNGQIIAVRGEPLPGRGFVSIYTDVTEQRRAERLVQEHSAELEERVRERTRELKEANDRLRAVNRINEENAEALRRSEERLSLITDAVPALIAYIDKDSIYRYANRGYAAWFGRRKEAMLGRHAAEIIGPALHQELAPQLARALNGETVSYEYAMAGGDGQTRHARSTLVPERDGRGKILGIFVLSLDITEQRQAQAALVQAQKMEAVGLLAGGMAHDFNNMLTVVIGNLVALQERDTPGTTPAPRDERAALLAAALLASRHGAGLIRRLLGFARQQPLAPRPVDIRALAAGLEGLLRPTLPENIALVLDFAPSPLWSLTDPHQLESALLNLALNARDAMPASGTLRLTGASVDLVGEEAAALALGAGRYQRLTLTDSGCGMDAATLAHACEPFFTTKRFGSGSGLGLAMTDGFARQSGGALHIASAPGAGTAVSLYLPAAPAGTTIDEVGEVQPSAATGPRPLVLLVEDDGEVRRVVRRQLTELGHPVLEAGDGGEALALLDTVGDVGVLVSDMVMPGPLDGHGLALEARRRRPEVGVLLISGYARGAAGGEDFRRLPKPFSQAELAAALAELGA